MIVAAIAPSQTGDEPAPCYSSPSLRGGHESDHTERMNWLARDEGSPHVPSATASHIFRRRRHEPEANTWPCDCDLHPRVIRGARCDGDARARPRNHNVGNREFGERWKDAHPRAPAQPPSGGWLPASDDQSYGRLSS